MAAFFAAIFINRQAVFILLIELCMEPIFHYAQDGFTASLLMACAYSIVSTANINLKSQIRHVLLCIGILNWLAAVDYLVAPDTETYFYICYPWLVNALDLLIIYHLLPSRRLNFVNGRFSLGTGRTSCL